MTWLDAFFGGIQGLELAGVPLPAEPLLDLFSGFTATDDPANKRTRVSASGGGGGNASLTAGTLGSRPAATAHALYYATDTQQLFVSSGSTWNLVSAYSGAGDWLRVMDNDLTAATTQTFATDGSSYSYAGFTNVVKQNSAHDAVSMQQTNGSGLIIQPDGPSDWSSAGQTAPSLLLPMAQIVFPRPVQWTDRFRLWAWISAENDAANYDNALIGIDDGGAAGGGSGTIKFGYSGMRGFTASSRGFWSTVFRGSSRIFASGPGSALTLNASNDVMVLDFQGHSVTSGTATHIRYGAHGGAGVWPDADTLIAAQTESEVGDTNWAPYATTQLLKNFFIRLGAFRAGSPTSLSVTIARIALDWLPS